MTSYFLDSSALVKRYLDENGSVWVTNLVQHASQQGIFISQITPVEVMSAIARRKREGDIEPANAHLIRRLLNGHVERDYVVLQITEGTVQQAITLVEQYPLRAYDAVQLASAVVLNSRSQLVNQNTIIFVSADVRLLNVAAEVGLQVLNPAIQN